MSVLMRVTTFPLQLLLIPVFFEIIDKVGLLGTNWLIMYLWPERLLAPRNVTEMCVFMSGTLFLRPLNFEIMGIIRYLDNISRLFKCLWPSLDKRNTFCSQKLFSRVSA